MLADDYSYAVAAWQRPVLFLDVCDSRQFSIANMQPRPRLCAAAQRRVTQLTAV